MTKEEAVLRLEVLKDFSQNNELKNMHEAIDMAIESLESDVRPVTRGEWIMKWHSFFGQEVPHCSICQSGSVLKSRYCPSCGAKME